MTSVPESEPAERPRRDTWGVLAARRAMRDLAEDMRRRGGYGVCAIQVARSDEMLEFVAIADDADVETQLLGRGSPVAAVFPALDQGLTIGAFTFVAREAMTDEAWERIEPHGVTPDVPPSDDPRAWRGQDILVAQIRDESGLLRSLAFLDLPRSGLRPTPAELRGLSAELGVHLAAILTTIEREEFAQAVRLAASARKMVRPGASRLSIDQLLTRAGRELRTSLRASALRIQAFSDATVGVGREPSVSIDATLWRPIVAAARRSWQRQDVILAEPGRVWGDDVLDEGWRGEITGHLLRHGLGEVILVPFGAGDEALGLIAVARLAGAERWTDAESSAVLDVGHDLGREVLNARASERERAAVAELRRLDDYRAKLIATVAHELKNPLGVVGGHLEMLESVEGLPEAARRSIEGIGKGTARLTDLVDGLAMLSKVRDVDRTAVQERVDLRPVCRDVVEQLRVLGGHQGVTLHLDEGPGPAVVAGDPSELISAISNLAHNALKYSDRGGNVWLRLGRRDNRVVVTCTDEGIGISPGDRKGLFREFFRSTNPAALDRPGSGLGLTIVHRIATRHGGSVDVESSPGRGSTFTLTLPAYDDPADA